MTQSFDVVSGDSFLATKLRAFFTEDMVREVMLPLLEQSSPVSLRSLDWLVTNYSKKYNVVCTTCDGSLFNIHSGYKAALATYRRTNFDPFRRRSRHEFLFDGKTRTTTLGQTNFIYWAFKNGVLEYAHKHAVEIESDMNGFAAVHKSKLKELKREGITHKRTTLSKTNGIKCHVYKHSTLVTFDL